MEVTPITSLRRSTKQELEDERKDEFDRSCIFLIFRPKFVKEEGIVPLVNSFNQELAYTLTITPEEYVQVAWDKVGCCVTQISDMMLVK